VFRGSVAVRSGLLTRRQLRGDTWRRLLQDVYVHRDVPVTHLLRAHAAVALLPSAVVTGCSAATVWGVPLAGPRDDVEVTMPPTTRMVRVQGVRTRRARLAADDVRRRHGLAVTTPSATALRLASVLSQDAAVVAIDQLIGTGVVDLGEIRDMAAQARGPGSTRARAAANLADGLAESPPETRLRILIGRSPLPPPVAQFRVVHENRFCARVDFAWPDRKVALEYDGLWHAETDQFEKDRGRLNRLREAGWQVVFVTAADMRRPEEVLRRIAVALGLVW
jgi:hypothetical protein